MLAVLLFTLFGYASAGLRYIQPISQSELLEPVFFPGVGRVAPNLPVQNQLLQDQNLHFGHLHNVNAIPGTQLRTVLHDHPVVPTSSFVHQQQFAVRPPASIVHRVLQSDESGQYNSNFQDTDGTTITDVGTFEPTNDGLDKVLVRKGSYAYTSPEGRPITISYISDKYGYRAVGDTIPGSLPSQPIQ